MYYVVGEWRKDRLTDNGQVLLRHSIFCCHRTRFPIRTGPKPNTAVVGPTHL